MTSKEWNVAVITEKGVTKEILVRENFDGL
jgi:hypothetical protein